jgi:acyl-ACP thioesterase
MFSIQEQVTTSRTDRNGKLKLFSAFQMMQDCSELWLDSAVDYRDFLKKNGFAQLLASRQVEVVRIPDFKEKLTVTTSIFGCEPLFGFRNTFIYDEAGNPCYKSWSLGVFCDLKNGRMKKLPQEVIDACSYDPKQEMNYKERRIIVPDGEVKTFAPVVVQRNDIDYNQHLNNAHYVRIASEYLPEDFNVKGVRVEYKVPVKLGEELVPQVLTAGNFTYVKLLKKELPCAILEFEQG